MKTLLRNQLALMPSTRALLVNYILFNYEEAADISDEYLIMEYDMLCRENRLDELFEQELLDNDISPIKHFVTPLPLRSNNSN